MKRVLKICKNKTKKKPSYKLIIKKVNIPNNNKPRPEINNSQRKRAVQSS
jgi:hypothetical protein